ncbi:MULTISPECIES: DUF397 domain-containing protein [Streptomyces]|uniref:DUF397 domain-containing protein n=1 Tax=Streptomyces TaxID=1883 RepID=UPI00206200D3|nr:MULTISPECIES: DUF397 domain-containing protein [Streptomyces]UPT44443.1 DUF397 domain-containing protein [Streptomyces sp. WAC00303]WIY78607.1 DUF397 domain-containing protein [Streptomyces anulatus]
MTTESTTQQWVKSSYSNSGSCVEWAPRTASTTGTVPVRDSKNPGGPALAVAAVAFSSFVAGIKAAGFDTTV